MLQEQITTALKTAMKAKDTLALEALRAVKSELLLLQTSGQLKDVSEQELLKVLQKLVKQRKDSAAIFSEQGRSDLAE
ncbi:MAG: GatB/YqeY domain-containing protein, partial [Flavobacteriaceae bacterium]|nr:GatB/YqeY domain-containing protein [Flavobacteriaceae bacterium]